MCIRVRIKLIGCTSTFTYGVDGLKRRSVVNGVTTDFVLDGQSVVRERRNNQNYATYLTGLRGPEYRRNDATGAYKWYVYNGLGSVVSEVDENGNCSALRAYDVYGFVRSGDTGTSKHKFVGQLGHPSEDETGLVYMGARFMDPSLGRFINEDPARNGNNWYTYCSNNPVNRVDESGYADTWDYIGEVLIRFGQGCLCMAIAGINIAFFQWLTGTILELNEGTPVIGPILKALGVTFKLQARGTVLLSVCAAIEGYGFIRAGTYLQSLGSDSQEFGLLPEDFLPQIG